MIYFGQSFETLRGRDGSLEAPAISQTEKPAPATMPKRPEAALPMARKPFEVAA